MEKYFAFYTEAVGAKPCSEELDSEKDALDLVKRAADTGDYRGLVIIYGKKLEFEPCRVVESWRVKEASDE